MTAAAHCRGRHWSPSVSAAACCAPPPPTAGRAMSDSSSSSATMRRKYVDPWDLDLREVSWRHSSDTTDCSADQVVSLSSAAGPESTRSDFVYVPGSPPKNKTGRTRRASRSAVRYDCCQCSPNQSLVPLPTDPIESYEYWEPAAADGCKQPPPYRYAAADDHFYPVVPGTLSNQCCLLYNVSRPSEARRNSRYNNSDMESACRAYDTSSGEYESPENLVTSQFRYNTLGHMKIDYSSNWNNLDKYICQV